MSIFNPTITKEYLADGDAMISVIKSIQAAIKSNNAQLVNDLLYDPYNHAEDEFIKKLRSYLNRQRIR